MLSGQEGDKTRLITIGSGNIHTSMTFVKTGPDGTKRLSDLVSMALSKVKTHIHMPEIFWLSNSDIKASSRNSKH